MKNLIIHLDMDGVLADFDGRINQQPELRSMRESLRALTKNLEAKLHNPYGGELHFKDVELALRGPQTDPNLHRLKSKLKETKARIFGFASQEGFFLGLDKMHDADALVDGVIRMTGRKPHILTAPLESSKTCREEKVRWIELYYADKVDKVYIEQHKFKYAAPNHVLIDDTPKKVRPFREAGGLAILHNNTAETLYELQKLIDS